MDTIKSANIAPVLKYIVDELNFYQSNPAAQLGEFAQIGNISQLESSANTSNADLQSKVILTLVNIDEEKTLKNSPSYVRDGEGILKRNPTIFLNLYILFSCAAENYETALTKLSRVIGFFQQKCVFTTEHAEVPFPEEHVEKIIMDMFSMNFEQINHLWGILGGKYIPSVLYKVRMVPIQYSRDPQGAEVVRAIRDNTN